MPALVLSETFATPFRDVEGWISEYKVGFQIRVAVVAESIALLDLPLNTSDCKVHLGEAPGSVIGFLPIDGNVAFSSSTIAVASLTRAYEIYRLNEHSRRATARVIDP